MGAKILSLYDGMACGMIAMLNAGVDIESYDAYEIDENPIKVATHNFPQIREHGDVFKADFTKYMGVDWVIGGSPCFVGGTMIMTSTGMKPIEEITVGEMVLTHKGRFKRVKEVMNRETNSTVIIKAENCGEVQCTEEHPFYTKDIVRKWNTESHCYERTLDKDFYWTDSLHFHNIRNSSSTILQQTYLSTIIESTKNNFEYSGVDIKVNQFTNKHVNNLNLKDEHIWYVIGRWLGDGWYNYKYVKKKKLSGIKICCGKHEIETLKDKLNLAGLKFYASEEKTVCKITICDLELALFLKRFGDGAENKHIPYEVMCLPDNLAKSFLEGYFDADGHNEGNMEMFSTVSKKLAYDIKYMINKYYKTSCSIMFRPNNPNVIEGRVVNTLPSYIGVFRYNKEKQSHYLVDDKFIYAPFKSVTKVYEKTTVYNLSVEDDESYTANGLVVHNCTYWSIAQKNNRETEASGMGWELFCQYVRAIKEAQPKYFIYENNKSMSKAIRDSITKEFGFDAICINSALLSAQSRQRLYWVGIRNEDGTYSKVDVQQPIDKGILLKDILDDRYAQHIVKDDVDNIDTLTEPIRVGALPRPNGELSTSQAFRVYSVDGKAVTQSAGGGGAGGKTGLYAVPIKVGEIGKGGQGNRIYSVDGKSVSQTATSGGIGSNTGLYAIPYENVGETETVQKAIPEIVDKLGYLPEMFNAYNRSEITKKSPTLSTGIMVTSSCAVNKLERVENKQQPVYEVKDGLITIKGKQYPIKLPDGYYIIRKLTISEAKRLQTVPEWYDMSVLSNSQAYKCLGNGWTCDVITHLILSVLNVNKL